MLVSILNNKKYLTYYLDHSIFTNKYREEINIDFLSDTTLYIRNIKYRYNTPLKQD